MSLAAIFFLSGPPLLGEPAENILKRLATPDDQGFEQPNTSVIDRPGRDSNLPFLFLPRSQSTNIAALKWTAPRGFDESALFHNLRQPQRSDDSEGPVKPSCPVGRSWLESVAIGAEARVLSCALALRHTPIPGRSADCSDPRKERT